MLKFLVVYALLQNAPHNTNLMPNLKKGPFWVMKMGQKGMLFLIQATKKSLFSEMSYFMKCNFPLTKPAHTLPPLA